MATTAAWSVTTPKSAMIGVRELKGLGMKGDQQARSRHSAPTQRATLLFQLSGARLFLLMEDNRTGIPVDSDRLTMLDPLGAVANPEHGRDSVLPGHDGAVSENAAHIGHQARGVGKELSPGRRVVYKHL